MTQSRSKKRPFGALDAPADAPMRPECAPRMGIKIAVMADLIARSPGRPSPEDDPTKRRSQPSHATTKLPVDLRFAWQVNAQPTATRHLAVCWSRGRGYPVACVQACSTHQASPR